MLVSWGQSGNRRNGAAIFVGAIAQRATLSV
jgi:hypothetical protein